MRHRLEYAKKDCLQVGATWLLQECGDDDGEETRAVRLDMPILLTTCYFFCDNKQCFALLRYANEHIFVALSIVLHLKCCLIHK